MTDRDEHVIKHEQDEDRFDDDRPEDRIDEDRLDSAPQDAENGDVRSNNREAAGEGRSAIDLVPSACTFLS